MASSDSPTPLERAGNPETPAAELERLATCDDADVREAVARHPNTPPEVLYDLAGDFPEAFFENPVLELLFLEDPSLLERVSESALEAEETPEKWLRRASRSSSTRVRTAAAANPRLPRDVLGRLLADENDRVRSFTIDGRPALSEKALRRLSADPSCRVRQSVARHGNTPDAVIEQLAEDENADVRFSVSRRSPSSSTVVQTFENGESRTRSVAGAGAHSSLPVDVLETLSEDSDHRVRKAVSRNENTPEAVLDRLLEDPHKSVLSALVRRFGVPSFSFQQVQRLIRAGIRDRDLCYRAAGESDTPADVLELLADHPSERVRQKLAVHPHLPVAAVRRLARAESDVVRQAVSASRSLPIQTLLPIYEDLNDELRKVVASDPSTPLNALYCIAATDPDPYLRWLAVRNPRLTPEDLARLSVRPNSTVRREVAACPGAPAEAMRNMFSDSDAEVRERVARHANTPPGVLAYLRRDRHPKVRLRAKVTLRMRRQS